MAWNLPSCVDTTINMIRTTSELLGDAKYCQRQKFENWRLMQTRDIFKGKYELSIIFFFFRQTCYPIYLRIFFSEGENFIITYICFVQGNISHSFRIIPFIRGFHLFCGLTHYRDMFLKGSLFQKIYLRLKRTISLKFLYMFLKGNIVHICGKPR